jgi:hypothetical protein
VIHWAYKLGSGSLSVPGRMTYFGGLPLIVFGFGFGRPGFGFFLPVFFCPGEPASAWAKPETPPFG